MKIVKCDKTELKAVSEFYDAVTLYLEQHINYPKWRHKQYPAVDSVTKAIEANTQYACYENGKIIGAFVLNNDPQGDYDVGNWNRQLTENETLIIHSFAILPRMQGNGFGGQILEQITAIAKSYGAKALRLDIAPTNLPAKRLYEKHGFTYVGEYDLDRGYDDLPTFCLYELNLQ